jgi:hypothetical protein
LPTFTSTPVTPSPTASATLTVPPSPTDTAEPGTPTVIATP